MNFDVNPYKVIFPLTDDLSMRVEIERPKGIPLHKVKGDKLWTVGVTEAKVLNDTNPNVTNEYVMVCYQLNGKLLSRLYYAWPVKRDIADNMMDMMIKDKKRGEKFFFDNIHMKVLNVYESCFVSPEDSEELHKLDTYVCKH